MRQIAPCQVFRSLIPKLTILLLGHIAKTYWPRINGMLHWSISLLLFPGISNLHGPCNRVVRGPTWWGIIQSATLHHPRQLTLFNAASKARRKFPLLSPQYLYFRVTIFRFSWWSYAGWWLITRNTDIPPSRYHDLTETCQQLFPFWSSWRQILFLAYRLFLVVLDHRWYI